MKLMTPRAWAEKTFVEGSAPPETTLRRWMQEGIVPSKKIGGSWFIDDDAWSAEGDDLVQRVLQAG
ncbi:hypothetical protein B0E46_15600 [Rhodanobacter sp. B04]|nr:hypothetical protein B0E46_15600 [Rhodanobacter sp. B04]